MNERIIDTIRTKYQYEMKNAVSKISIELEKPNKDSVEEIDSWVDVFSRTKEKASYFEAILKNLKGEEE